MAGHAPRHLARHALGRGHAESQWRQPDDCLAGVQRSDDRGLAGSGYLTVGGTANASTTFAGAIGGAGGLGKIGSGVLTLTGASNYSGGTAINAGILQLGNSAALGAGAVALSSGTLDLAGDGILVGGLSGASGTITNSTSGAAATFSVNQIGSTSFSGQINDGASTVAMANLGGTLTLTRN